MIEIVEKVWKKEYIIIDRGDEMPTNNFQRALDYIEDHITENISLNDVSGKSGYSVPQFYRLFKRLTGDTVGEYILRRRMSLAAVELKETNKSVAEIAFQYGFASHDVFTRGFKRVYGILPNQYRRSKDILPPLKRLRIADSIDQEDSRQTLFRVLHQESTLVIGMECDASLWDQDGAIGRLWSEFLPRVTKINQLAAPMIMYGICEHETCREDHFRYLAGVKVTGVENVPEGMIARTIRAQKFFQASVSESVSIPDAYASTENYAKSLAYVLDEYDDIEVYEEEFQDPNLHDFKLMIAIK